MSAFSRWKAMYCSQRMELLGEPTTIRSKSSAVTGARSGSVKFSSISDNFNSSRRACSNHRHFTPNNRRLIQVKREQNSISIVNTEILRVLKKKKTSIKTDQNRKVNKNKMNKNIQIEDFISLKTCSSFCLALSRRSLTTVLSSSTVSSSESELLLSSPFVGSAISSSSHTKAEDICNRGNADMSLTTRGSFTFLGLAFATGWTGFLTTS